MTVKGISLIVGTVLCSVYVIIAQGVKPNLFTIWNILPIVVCYFVLNNVVPKYSKTFLWGSIVFSVITVGFILFFHTAWYLDLGQTKTGSSTAGLMFIFLPIYSIIFGGLAFMFTWIIKK